MWKKREEKKVVALIEDHLVKVGESLQGMMSVIENYLKGSMDAAESGALAADNAESQADIIRREIADRLHQGAFLPIFREDVMQLVAMVDRMASHAEDCCNFIVIQRPDVPDAFTDDFLELARDSVSILSPLQEGVIKLYEDFDVTLAKVAEVHSVEAEADELELALSRRIFSTDLALAQKMHLRQLVDVIVEITDIAEDAAEILESLIVKKRV